MISIFAIEGLPEFVVHDNIAEIVLKHCQLKNDDVLVITSKIVSKSEGRVIGLDPLDEKAFENLVISESKRVLRRRGDLLITETHHGFVCANAGIDRSNVDHGQVVLLPVNPDLSARKIREHIKGKTGLKVAVIISDTFGRTWRRGVVDVALGCAGIGAILDLRGTTDNFGNQLKATEIAIADEIASAAELAKPKAAGTPVVVIRGLDKQLFRQSSVTDEIVRIPSEDLFR